MILEQQAFQAQLEIVRGARDNPLCDDDFVAELELDLAEAERIRNEAFYRSKLNG